MNLDDRETDNTDEKSAPRATVVQLNDGDGGGSGGTTNVLVDGGKAISGMDDPAPGKTSPVHGCELGNSGSQGGDGSGGSCSHCRSPVDVLVGCHAAWLSGIELAQEFVHGLLTTHLRLIKRSLLVLVLIAFVAYLIVSVWKSGLCAIAVIVFALIVVLYQCLRLLKRFCGQRIDTYVIAPVRQVRHSKPCLYLKW